MNQSSNLLVSVNQDSTSYGPILDAKWPDFTLLVPFSAACSAAAVNFRKLLPYNLCLERKR
jgi:hypothetical protein